MTDDDIDALYAELHTLETAGRDTADLQIAIEHAEQERAEEMAAHFRSRGALRGEVLAELFARVDDAIDPVQEMWARRREHERRHERLMADVIERDDVHFGRDDSIERLCRLAGTVNVWWWLHVFPYTAGARGRQ